jgi:hypothetical protein
MVPSIHKKEDSKTASNFQKSSGKDTSAKGKTKPLMTPYNMPTAKILRKNLTDGSTD